MTPEEIPAEVLEAWVLDASTVRSISMGWINRTFRAGTRSGETLIVQRVNPIFGPAVNRDIHHITQHLVQEGIPTPQLIATDKGTLFLEARDGIWRAMTCLEGEPPEAMTPKRAYSAAHLVARFHDALEDCRHDFEFSRGPAHDTAAHMHTLQQTHANQAAHPLHAEVAQLVAEIRERYESLPSEEGDRIRIIHGDLKTTNILFDSNSDEAFALVDLDTLTRGTLTVELGDALRSWANTTRESDPEATFDAEIFEAAIRGYVAGRRKGNPADELYNVVAGTERIALELASRFANDVYEDRYFGFDETLFATRVEHNLSRTRAQLNLARSIEEQRERLHGVVLGLSTR